MKSITRWICAWLALTVPAVAAAAVSVPGPEHLPADTWILVHWHGVANTNKVKGSNPVMQLWNDPQFAAARDQIITRIATGMGGDSPGSADRAVIDDFLAVLENPAVLGVAGDPLARGKDTVHMYVVVNAKGKEAAWSRINGREKPGPNAQVSTYPFRGVQVKKTVTTIMPPPPPAPPPTADKPAEPPPPPQPHVSTDLEAVLGDYRLYADNQQQMESLITQLQAGKPAASSLLNDPAYQRAQHFRAAGPLLEAFVRIPDLSKLPLPQSPQMNMQASIRALHLERAQGLWFSAGMGHDRMLMRAALIGDTSPGSLLDLIGGNVKDFRTLATAPATASFGAFRLDLPALYATVMSAVKAGMPPDRGPAVSMMIDSMTMAQTGLRASELLSLFTGEIGFVSNGEEKLDAGLSGALPALLMIPVTRGEQLLALLQSLAGPMFTNQEQLSGATVVKVDPSPIAGALPAGSGNKINPFFLAVSPDMLVLSPDHGQLEASLARDAAASAVPAGSLAADAKFQSTRKFLPSEVNSLFYTDFSRINWQARADAMHRMMAKQRQDLLDRAATIEKGDADKAPDPAAAERLRKQAEQIDGMEQFIAELLPLAGKHLKVSVGGSWKAADGVFFDSYVN